MKIISRRAPYPAELWHHLWRICCRLDLTRENRAQRIWLDYAINAILNKISGFWKSACIGQCVRKLELERGRYAGMHIFASRKDRKVARPGKRHHWSQFVVIAVEILPDRTCSWLWKADVWNPWRCLCFGFRSQITYSLRRRRTILQWSHIRLIAERTFIPSFVDHSVWIVPV